MKSLTKAIVIGASLLSSSFAMADGLYGGLNYSAGSLSADGAAFTPKPTSWDLRLGTYITENIAIEGRYSIAHNAHDYTSGNTTTTTSVKGDSMMSIFAKADLALSESVTAYGLAGYTSGKFVVTTGSSTNNVKDSGLSYGVGIEYGISEGVNLSAEYVQYMSGKNLGANLAGTHLTSNYTYKATSLGLTFAF